jgi:hypothetical protein
MTFLLAWRLGRLRHRVDFLHTKQKFARKRLDELKTRHRKQAVSDSEFANEAKRMEMQLAHLTHEVATLVELERRWAREVEAAHAR